VEFNGPTLVSSIDQVSEIADRATISMIVGAKDDVTLPSLSEASRQREGHAFRRAHTTYRHVGSGRI